MKYEVTIYASIAFSMEVEADNEQDAISQVEEEFMFSSVSDCDLNSQPIVIADEVTE